MPVTINEIAKAAGVSVATVSRVLTNNDHPVNEATRQRVLNLANEMGYRPNMMARSLKTDRTLTIGIIVDNIISPFTPTMIRGIQDHLKQAEYFSVVINSDWNPETETRAIHDLISRSIDGIIFVESFLREPNPTLDLANKPYVFVHRIFGNVHRNSVGVDERYGAQLAMDHLIKLGHRRIGFINGPAGWHASDTRYLGYKETLAQNNIPFDPELVVEGDWEVQSGFPAVKHFLGLSARPTALFAANDFMALGAIYALQDEGLSVPGDIAVVGYDDREIASLSRPTITTVRMPCYEMGEASAKLLLGMIANQARSAEPVKVQGKLIVRESCGAEKGKRTADTYHSQTTPRRLLMRKRRPST
ncbi:MAG TPA: LacI family DNA-binding transcriptional regulator [Anaerolineae bacterium]|nr:LacI family DNA-binding transcriptional regulator [Anaerolineae bacterium]